MRIAVLIVVVLVVVCVVSPRPSRRPAGVDGDALRAPAPTSQMVEAMLRQRREGKFVEDFRFTPDESRPLILPDGESDLPIPQRAAEAATQPASP